MSEILGTDVLVAKLDTFDRAFAEFMEARIGDEMLALQKETAELIPVDEGIGRDTILKPEAIAMTQSKGGRGKSWAFGFLTPAMKKAAFYLFFVEFGTKGYEPKQERSAGVYKNGRRRFQRIKRRIPARRAQPFFRPAVANFLARIRQKRLLANIYAAAVTAAGLTNARVRD